MSSNYYSVSGVGCPTYKLKPSTDKFKKFIVKAKLENELKEVIVEALSDDGVTKNNYDLSKVHVTLIGTLQYNIGQNGEENIIDIDNYSELLPMPNESEYNSTGLAFNFLSCAISREIEQKTGEEGAVIYATSNCDGFDAVLYEAACPWHYHDKKIKLLSMKEYQNIFIKWLKLFGLDNDNESKDSLFSWVDVEMYG